MKRLRLVFVVLAALLWLPLLGLVIHALRTLEQEEAGRYKAVAERIFDEMERELTEALKREDERPSQDYALDIARSLSDLPFVLGHFERSPARGLRHTPFAREAEAVQRALDEDSLSLAVASNLARGQAPGSTQELTQQGLGSKTYDSLSSLNRGAWSREQSSLRKKTGQRPSSGPKLSGTAALDAKTAGDASPTVEPLSAVPGGGDFLILVREARREGSTVSQGLVIDLPALLSWLATRVLEQGELGRAARLTLLEKQTRLALDEAPSGSEHSYRHRFGEPFSSMSALLTLERLPELEASAYMYGLSALLLVLGALGLFASYRMVAAIVAYAERRSNFVSAVTHELKTPLTSIRMYGEMLRDDVVPDPEKRGRYYRIITAESERLTRLIDNVLELAKLERGQRPVSLALTDVTSVLRETLEVLEPHACELGFTLDLQADADLPAVRVDRDALAQVLFNLVDNALKYGSDSAQRRVTIRCERQGTGVCIRVADHGPGVEPQHLRKIWQPFFRGERELTRKHKGTGIGLALVRGLVQRMGGNVSGRNTNPGFEVCVTLGG
ncbi:MAG TPA: HAMP domain-containing sensor histidine kinase [Polyangiaceae bacterium]|nr:HAMP domain-containing sensor histidine kinase [Polyangiaceae bacterium]